MWEEWRTTVWQRSLETVVHRESAVEAGRRNAGKKALSKPLRLNLWKNRRLPIEKKKKKKKKNIFFKMNKIFTFKSTEFFYDDPVVNWILES